MTKILLETRNLKKSFNHVNGVITLFKNLNIKIKEGDMVAVIGPSGSGKSSLLHLFALLDQPSGGKIIINHSNKKDDVIYVTLILTRQESKKPKKIYIGRDDLFGSVDLSVFIDNQSQIMIKQTDRFYEMLVDPNMEIFIR